MMFGVLGVSGCVSVFPPPTSYLLSAAAPAPPAAIAPVVVGVGPISIPAYLDRSSIVVRTGDGGEVGLSGEHRWAESLRDGIPRILAGNLSAMIPTDAVPVFPWRAPWTVQYRVSVDILRFDGALGRSVVLDARWRLLDAAGRELLLRAAVLQESIADSTYAALVAAESRLLASLSRDIAAEIRRRLRKDPDVSR
jgi:uncharacterized lipoprotein YmbA